MEGVLHVARGMVGGEVQRREVVVVRLHLGPLGHREAEPLEDLDDLLGDARDGMHRARQRAAAREREVWTVGREGATALRRLQLVEPRGEALLELTLRPVGLLADLGPLRGRDGAERAEQRGQLARATEHAHPHLLEIGRGAGPGDLRQGPIEDLLDPRVPGHAQARWARAVSASLAKAVGSDTASSARIFRSRATPAFLSPAMKTE